MQPARDLSIGQVATRTGLSVPTIRYYEEIGLVRQAGRREGGLGHHSPRKNPTPGFV